MHALSAFLKQFSELPIEIAHWIVTLAAEDSLARRARWVAQSLALVCRAFYDIVEPIIVRSVRFNCRNGPKLKSMRKDRFAKTAHIDVYGLFKDETFLSFYFPSVTHYEGQIVYLNHLAADPAFRPQRLTLPGYSDSVARWAGLKALSHVTRLHLTDVKLSSLAAILGNLPLSTMHVVIDPDVHYLRMCDLLESVAPFLRAPGCALQRLIIRSLDQVDRMAVQQFATAERDRRIWFARRVPIEISQMEKDDYDAAIWNGGSQLFVQ